MNTKVEREVVAEKEFVEVETVGKKFVQEVTDLDVEIEKELSEIEFAAAESKATKEKRQNGYK